MDYIPHPSTNATTTIKLDGRWGDNDPLNWPDTYYDYHCHFPAIPRHRPGLDIAKDNDAIVHVDFSPDFFVSASATLTGLGHLRSDVLKLMREVLSKYRDGWTKIKEQEKGRSPLLPLIAQHLARGIDLLETLPMTRKQVQYLFRFYQRKMLEGMALCHYLLVIKPRMERLEPDLERARHEPEKVVGAIFFNPTHANAYWRAAVPVWIVFPAKMAGSIRVDKLVEPRYSSQAGIEMVDHPGHKGNFFVGTDPHERYNFMMVYTRRYLTGSNPFYVPTGPSAMGALGTFSPSSMSTGVASSSHGAPVHTQCATPLKSATVASSSHTGPICTQKGNSLRPSQPCIYYYLSRILIDTD